MVLNIYILAEDWNLKFRIFNTDTHERKGIRLEIKKLNDLVPVKFNVRLRHKQEDKSRDPIAMKNLEDGEQVEEWSQMLQVEF